MIRADFRPFFMKLFKFTYFSNATQGLELYSMCRVLEVKLLQPASFRFHLTMDIHTLSYMFSVIGAHPGLSSVRTCLCRTYKKIARSNCLGLIINVFLKC